MKIMFCIGLYCEKNFFIFVFFMWYGKLFMKILLGFFFNGILVDGSFLGVLCKRMLLCVEFFVELDSGFDVFVNVVKLDIIIVEELILG